MMEDRPIIPGEGSGYSTKSIVQQQQEEEEEQLQKRKAGRWRTNTHSGSIIGVDGGIPQPTMVAGCC